jgi:hypothetical protein
MTDARYIASSAMHYMKRAAAWFPRHVYQKFVAMDSPSVAELKCLSTEADSCRPGVQHHMSPSTREYEDSKVREKEENRNAAAQHNLQSFQMDVSAPSAEVQASYLSEVLSPRTCLACGATISQSYVTQKYMTVPPLSSRAGGAETVLLYVHAQCRE